MEQRQLNEEQLSEINGKIIEEAVEHIMNGPATKKDTDEITIETIKQKLVDIYGSENVTEQIIKDNVLAYYIWRRATRYQNYNKIHENQ